MISDPPLRARTRLDEILGRGTSPRLLERPVTGEKKDTPQPEKSSAGKGDTVSTDTDLPNTEMKSNQHEALVLLCAASLMDDEDFTFGSYQPTMGSTPEGRQSRRQSVR